MENICSQYMEKCSEPTIYIYIMCAWYYLNIEV